MAAELRGTGRTTRMVLGLPTIGSVVFVGDKLTAAYIRDLVIMHHGLAVAAVTHVLVAPTVEDERHLLEAGPVGMAIYRDHALSEQRSRALPRVPRFPLDPPSIGLPVPYVGTGRRDPIVVPSLGKRRKPIPSGWECPRCGAILSPYVERCSCRPVLVEVQLAVAVDVVITTEIRR